MIVLKTPKGWTGPKSVDGHRVEGSWRSHQVPIDVRATPRAPAGSSEAWMKSYRPTFCSTGRAGSSPSCASPCPRGPRRMSANPVTNGGLLCRRLRLPDFRNYAVEVTPPPGREAENTHVLAVFLPDVSCAAI